MHSSSPHQDRAVTLELGRLREARLAQRVEARRRGRTRRGGLAYTALVAAAGFLVTRPVAALGGEAPAIVAGCAVAALSLITALAVRRVWLLALPCVPFIGLALYGYLSVSIRCGGCMPGYDNGLWAIDLVLLFLSEVVALMVGLAVGALPWSRLAELLRGHPRPRRVPGPARVPASR